MSFARELVAGLKNLPNWERVAFRRIARQGGLTADDEDEIYARLTEGDDTAREGDKADVEPLGPDDLEGLATSQRKVTLESVVAGAGCNALLPGSRLNVRPSSGITLVSGRNGSGKSSFVRLLRSAGNARIAPDILPDVFEHTAKSGPSTATFSLVVDGDRQQVEWKEGSADARLKSIAVFDRDCSAMYLEGGNVAEYLPGGLDVFAELVELRKRLRARTQAEAAVLREKTSEVPDGIDWDTDAGRAVHSWEGGAKYERDLSRHARWSENDEAQLRELEQQSQDVAAESARRSALIQQAAEVESRRSHLDGLKPILAALRGFLDTLPDKTLRANELRAQALNALADLRSRDATGGAGPGRGEFLPGTGTAEWIGLWEAAGAFSDSQAYPAAIFPELGAGDRCPLCQQPLGEQGQRLLSSLASFHNRPTGDATSLDTEEGQLAAQLDGVERQLASAVRGLSDFGARLRVSAELLPSRSGEEAREKLASIAGGLERLQEQLRIGSLQSTVVEDLSDDTWAAEQEVESLSEVLQENAEAFAAAASDGGGGVEDPRLKELRARKLVANNFEEIVRSHRLTERADELEGIAQSLTTTELTSLSKKLAAAVVTDRLMVALRAELAALGLGYMRAQVVSSGRAGVTTIRLAPPGKGFKKTDMSDVLSEGEQALMGLAAFFAELRMAGHSGPIVLDDPVTGLDQENKLVMAQRLAEAGRDRQVLVLTHDLEFARMLATAAGREGAIFDELAIARSGTRIGVVE